MARRALMGTGLMLWMLAAGCGEPFTLVGSGGSGGAMSSSSGGMSSSGTMSGSSSSSSGAPVQKGEKCDASGANPCAAGLYCKNTDCKEGTCEDVPTDALGGQYQPVCGCDHIVYWNQEVALAANMSYQLGADCDQSKLFTCTKMNNPCSSLGDDVHCNIHLSVGTMCVTPPPGICIKLPAACDGTTMSGKPCSDPTSSCQRACDMIQHDNVWFDVATCG